MHEQGPNEHSEHEDEETTPEREPKLRPRIYVASLADYNEGRLYGTWIDAAQDAKELEDAVKEMLADSPSPGAEEWAIHDYEGFGSLSIHENEDFETVARVAAGIVEHGEAFAAFAEFVDCDADLLDGFEDSYMGEWESGADFAEEMLDDMGLLEPIISQLPEDLQPYVKINHERYFDDLVSDGQVTAVANRGGGIYVFRIP